MRDDKIENSSVKKQKQHYMTLDSARQGNKETDMNATLQNDAMRATIQSAMSRVTKNRK